MLTDAGSGLCSSVSLFGLWIICLISEESPTFCITKIKCLVTSISFRQNLSLQMSTVIAAR